MAGPAQWMSLSTRCGNFCLESLAGQDSYFVVKIPLETSSDFSCSTKPKGKR
jgi:hypothetical protein